MSLNFIECLHLAKHSAFHTRDGLTREACAENYYRCKTEIFSYNWAAQDLEKDLRLASQAIVMVLSAGEPFSDHSLTI
jgi:hypothetical protein